MRADLVISGRIHSGSCSYAGAAGGAADFIRWYVAYTLPHREFSAGRELEKQHFRVFVPRHRKMRCHARKRETVLAPMFPRYIFVGFDIGLHRWRSVNGTVGIAYLIMQGERPLPVPYGVVEALIAHTDELNVLPVVDSMTIGQPVKIVAGPFAELIGTLERCDSAGRIRLLLDIMDGSVPVVVSREMVSAIT